MGNSQSASIVARMRQVTRENNALAVIWQSSARRLQENATELAANHALCKEFAPWSAPSGTPTELPR
jgi:hypothetical protein